MLNQRSWVHHIQRLCLGNRCMSAVSIAAEVELVGGQPISTVRPYAAHCIRLVYMAVIPEGKPLLKMMHKKGRKQFAEDKQTKDMDYWNNVLWSDEIKINIIGSDGVKRVWRQPGEESKDKCVLPTVKHSGGSVMVWGCMSAAGTVELQFIDGTMNANMYCDILKQSMIPSLQRLGHRELFQHDNDPKHTAKTLRANVDGLAKHVSRPNPYWSSVGHPQMEGGGAQGSLTSTSSVMSSWRSGRGLQWQPVKLWWTFHLRVYSLLWPASISSSTCNYTFNNF